MDNQSKLILKTRCNDIDISVFLRCEIEKVMDYVPIGKNNKLQDGEGGGNSFKLQIIRALLADCKNKSTIYTSTILKI